MKPTRRLALVIGLTLAVAGPALGASVDWNTTTGDWLGLTNWTPNTNFTTSTDTGVIGGADGSQTEVAVTTTNSTFTGSLTINGNGDATGSYAGGTLKVTDARTITGTITLHGGRIVANIGSNRNLSFTSLDVTDDSVLEVDATNTAGRVLSLANGALSGSGNLTLLGKYASASSGDAFGFYNLADSSGYSGTITARSANLDWNSGNVTLGATSAVVIEDGLLFRISVQSNPTTTFTAGSFSVSNGGLIKSGHYNATLNGPVAMTGNNTLLLKNGYTNTALTFAGVFSGSGTLVVSSGGTQTANEALHLSGSANTYSGQITIANNGRLTLDYSGSLPTSGDLASLIVQQGGILNIGADADILVSALTLYNANTTADDVVAAGTTYTSADVPTEYAGLFTWGNAGSSITVAIPEPTTLAFLAVGGLAMAGAAVSRRRKA